MKKYSNYIYSENNNYDNITENENYKNCCFIIGFTTTILSISFIIGYIAYKY